MAPFSLMAAGVSWLAKSFTVFSSTSVLTSPFRKPLCGPGSSLPWTSRATRPS
ncbi:hypothetical protein E3U43_012812 [Larimichthys crocea]|uniref:Uncharacterized protein n=1 Tax=Larimichthys crocea TaxID=215358 RepID=A0ACD3RT64_LARCR|nr:hypothetical protein E3U43_012812 [Larimichthys crocea]